MIEDLEFEGLSLTVEDVERSLAFYRRKLGLEVVYEALPAFALVRGSAVRSLLPGNFTARTR